MSMDGDLHYPNIIGCRVRLSGNAASSRPPVTLPSDCLDAVNMPLRESPYDFSLEHRVLKKKEDVDNDRALETATGREELEKATLAKMKSVTGANDGVCITILENNGYNIKNSIEAFYQR